MADATSHEQKDQEHNTLEKKLRKREKRLLERLQEAQVAQKNAAERFQHAEARLLKRMARTQRLEARLATLRQQLETFTSPSVMALDIALLPTESGAHSQEDNLTTEAQKNETDASAKARAARSVAKATEDAARLAIERALRVALRLEYMATGRHLSQELLSLEAEAAKASVAALDAELAAQEAERLANAEPIEVSLPFDPDAIDAADKTALQSSGTHATETLVNDTETLSSETETPVNAEETLINDTGTPTNDNETPPVENATNTHGGLPTAMERTRVEEIDEDEEMVEMVAAMMIADVAAANAAKAESLAEEASSRTAEARRIVQEADAVLERIRVAIRSGNTSGDAAEAILFDAERDATHAHARLADAESAEERARRAAMDAEAEAEVAEGMAFAAGDRNEHAEIQREEESPMLEGQQHTGDTGEIERLNTDQNNTNEKNPEDEDTVEVPIVHPQL